MVRLLRNDLYLCLKRREFKLSLLLLFFLCFIAFFLETMPFYEQLLSFVRSAANQTFIQGVDGRIILQLLAILLPLLVGGMYSDAYSLEKGSNITAFTLSRADIKSVLLSKAIIVCAVPFFTIFLVLSLNQFLSLLAFPIHGFDNSFNLPYYDIGYQNFREDIVFENLRISFPYTYNFLYIFIISIFGSLFSLLQFGLHFIFPDKKFIPLAIVFFSCIMLDVVAGVWELQWISVKNQYVSLSNATTLSIGMWMFLLFIAGITLVGIQMKKGSHF